VTWATSRVCLRTSWPGMGAGMSKPVNPLGPKPACRKDALLCPACGSFPGNAKPITDRYGWTWSLHTCYRCGVEYQARPMTDEARIDFYASGRYRTLCAQVTGKPWDDPEYLRKAQHEYGLTWEGADGMSLSGLHWLDYGGSTGVVSAIIARAHARNKERTIVVADYGDGATTTPEQALSVPEGTYDAILCCQTLDHLAEPRATLCAFRHVAKPNARLFVDVVKLEHTQYKIDHDTYYPTASAFLSLVERSGWRVLWLDGGTNPTHWSILAEKP
jgi:2-polyprenyl-3-methyl-5-hydroxy-6-metoxy-1,4-benzoquinol methylase